jgi:uncharacterized metal-binding protein
MSENHPQCALCPFDLSERYCRREGGGAPEFCPSVRDRELVRETRRELERPDVREFARQASIQEAAGYSGRQLGYGSVRPIKPRIEEILEFAVKMQYTRLGLVFCVGLRREAERVHELFAARGFEVVSVACKAGRVPKEELDLTEEDKISPGSFESMCNPILQAMVCNRHETHFNVLLGLCVGHDSLFFRYAEAPVTVLAVKDRLLGHNPLAAVYQCDAYYRYLKAPQ